MNRGAFHPIGKSQPYCFLPPVFVVSRSSRASTETALSPTAPVSPAAAAASGVAIPGLSTSAIQRIMGSTKVLTSQRLTELKVNPFLLGPRLIVKLTVLLRPQSSPFLLPVSSIRSQTLFCLIFSWRRVTITTGASSLTLCHLESQGRVYAYLFYPSIKDDGTSALKKLENVNFEDPQVRYSSIPSNYVDTKTT